MENGYCHFFLLAAKTYKRPEGKGQTKHPTGPPKMTAAPKKNIRESGLDFTARFGEINPDIPYLCRRSLSGSKELFLHLSIRRVIMEE